MSLTDKKIVDGKSGFELEDLRNEKLHMVCLKGAELHGVDARDTSLEHVNFVNSKWQHIYFSNVHLDMIQMGGTIFENIKRPAADRSQLNEEPGTDGWINVNERDVSAGNGRSFAHWYELPVSSPLCNLLIY